MRALIICDNHGAFPQPLLDRIPACLLPVGGKPLVWHMLEHLSLNGVKEVHVAVAHQADYVRSLLDDGRRFGLTLDYLPFRSYAGLGELLHLGFCPIDDNLIVLPGLVLTDLRLDRLTELRGNSTGPVAVRWPGQGKRPGGEILLLRGCEIPSLPAGCAFAAEALESVPGAVVVSEGQARLVWDLATYWQANAAVLKDEAPFSAAHTTRRGPHCRVHPRAILEEPVILGQNVEIGAGCRIGPMVVVGDNCIVDDGVEMTESVVLPGTFAGLNTSLERCLACQDLLVGFDDASALHVPDPFILGQASAVSLSMLASTLFQRLLAALVLAATLPVLGLLALWGLFRPGLWQKRTVVTGRGLESLDGQWGFLQEELRRFDCGNSFLSRLPALWDVVRGAVNLIGVEPLDPAQARELLGGYAEVRFSCRAGLFAPWEADGPLNPDDLERRVMEVYYIQTRSLGEDMRLAAKALVRTAIGR